MDFTNSPSSTKEAEIRFPSQSGNPSPVTSLPLLPTEVIAAAEHQEETQNGEEDDAVSGHHQATGSPFDLLKNKWWVSDSVQ